MARKGCSFTKENVTGPPRSTSLSGLVPSPTSPSTASSPAPTASNMASGPIWMVGTGSMMAGLGVGLVMWAL